MADESAPARSAFDRDTAVRLEHGSEWESTFAADVSPAWRAGRGPHGGYLAAMLLRALIETVADPARSPRSLTVHYPRAPEPGPVSIHTRVERAGRSLSTLSARMEQDGRLIALVLSAFSVAWNAPELSDLKMPNVPGPDAAREAGTLEKLGAPPFTRHLVMQPRIGGTPFAASAQPMEIGGWLGLAQRRPIDALSLAFFSDALFPPPFVRLQADERVVAPTIDLTIHFRVPTPRTPDPDPDELCLARFRTRLVHEGFFDEDGVIWASDGTVLAQSRQLAILLPVSIR
ncbi:MAG TPA: thioesterase family protein [Solirubrobacteraceae bacterium]|nr:thioesterase family protein [Solirubrobacteraceae bacterium]